MDILNKALSNNIYEVATKTPLEKAKLLSADLQNNILFKREELQPTFSFKVRGAISKINSLPRNTLELGVIASSAGNHGLGVALAAKTKNISATIVVPKNASKQKISLIRNLGANVILHGEYYDDAEKLAKKISKDKKITFIHPFNDLEVIAGQGTIALELFQQHPKKIDYVFVAIGGGGLISGISSISKIISPNTQIIGIQPHGCSAMFDSIKKKKIITLKEINQFADGVATKKVGNLTFKITSKLVDKIITVSNDEICSAIKDFYAENRTILEPSGALSIAGIKKFVNVNNIKNKTCICITCGANMTFEKLRYVSERTEIGEKKEAVFSIQAPETTGSFRNLIKALGSRSIKELHYRYNDEKIAFFYLGFETADEQDKFKIQKKISNLKFKLIDLSSNEFAKLHLKSMIGGKPQKKIKEYLFRIFFPETKGALKNFLKGLNKKFNITLFHYRDIGTDNADVLIGIENIENQLNEIDKDLENIGYKFTNESNNEAYKMFLSSQ